MTSPATSTNTATAAVGDRRLPRSAVAGVGVAGFLLLVIAALTEGYWQALLINLGTGALLFVALEYMLYGTVERVTKALREALDAVSAERGMELVRWTEQVSMEELPAVERELQAIAPLPTQKLAELRMDIAALEQMNADEQMKRMSMLSVLSDKYGVQSVRRVMAARGERNADELRPPGTPA
jgi:Flp pilus assembly protein TadB